MSEERVPYYTLNEATADTVELRLLGEPLAVEALAIWLEERLEMNFIRERPSRKTARQVLRYFVVQVG